MNTNILFVIHVSMQIQPISRTIRRNVLIFGTTIACSGKICMTKCQTRVLVTCRMHAVDPYTYLVDVLQRISEHPAKRVLELTPRVWKSLFAHDPLPSALGHHNHDPPH